MSMKIVCSSLLTALLLVLHSIRVGAQLVPYPNVELFTGAFTCTIPLLVVPGPHGVSYPVVLSYSSDIHAEADASWVGYGWSLEPPSITRSQRGFPDDMDRRDVEYYEKNEYKRLSTTFHGSEEILSKNLSDAADKKGIGLSLAPMLTLSYDNIKGFDVTVGLGLGVSKQISKGVSIGAGLSYDTDGRFSTGIGSTLALKGVGYSYDPRSTVRIQPGLASAFSGTAITVSPSVTIGTTEAGISVTVLRLGERRLRRKALGYLHTSEAYMATDEDASPKGYDMDYVVERDRRLSVTEVDPLPLPSPAFDYFIVNAPGISGSFRAHLPLPMDVRPPVTVSSVDISAVSAKGTSLPPYLGFGLGAFRDMPTRYSYSSGDYVNGLTMLGAELKLWRTADKPFFRYVGDEGSRVRYSSSTSLLSSSMQGPWAKEYYPYNRGERPATNKLIKYRTHGEVESLVLLQPSSKLSSDRQSNLLLKSSMVPLDGITPAINEAIAEFEVVDELGGTTQFAAPNYSHGFSSRMFGTRGGVLEREATNRPNTRIAFRNGVPSDYDSEVGSSTRLRHTYATEWKATAILGSNYIDVGNDGPDDNDFGGWVKFGYTKPVARRWRSPSCGFWLNRNTVESAKDDILSFSEGTTTTRELRAIETATHVAYFYTSTHPSRESEEVAPDDLGANYPVRRDAHEPRQGDQAAGGNPTYGSDNKACYLARIDLYAKGTPYRLVKRVHFVYDYSVAPNNITSNAIPGGNGRYGKLTLRRIWEEHGNVADGATQPLDFFYEYPEATTPATSPTETRDGFDVGDVSSIYLGVLPLPVTTTENPEFDLQNVDAWGQITGRRPYRNVSEKEREKLSVAPLQPWDATTSIPDAAPWRLKTVRFSSGARVVPVYEHRTYGYVQDKRALTMAPLVNDASVCGDVSNVATSDALATAPNRYVVDLKMVGVPSNAGEAGRYLKEFERRFVTSGEPLYFDFATSYCSGSVPATFYTRGYATVRSASLSEPEPGTFHLAIQLGEMSKDEVVHETTYAELYDVHKSSPYGLAAKKYFNDYKVGCELKDFLKPDFSDPLSLLASLRAVTSSLVGIDVRLGYVHTQVPQTDILRSSLRLPVWAFKTGGGPRVRQLLQFSPKNTAFNAVADLTGTIFEYDHVSDNASEVVGGVATSEPSSIRFENPIVGVLPSFYDKVREQALSGDQLAVAEGPLAESYLPSPSIGYAKVVQRHINESGNNAGHTVHEFYTAKDVPTFTAEHSPAKIHDDYNERNNFSMSSLSRHRLSLSQSYAIHSIDAHGLPKAQSHYSGLPHAVDAILTEKVSYDYGFKSDSLYIYDAHDRALRARIPIDAMDIITERRAMQEYSATTYLELTVLLTTPIPIPAFGFQQSILDHNTNTNVTVKSTRYSPFLRRTIRYASGRTDTTSYDAVDARTGAPAIVSSFDSYHAASLNANISPENRHLGVITSVVDLALTQYADLGKKSSRYREQYGANRFIPYVGSTMITSLTSSSAVIQRRESVPFGLHDLVDDFPRREYFASRYKVGDEIEFVNSSDQIIATAVIEGVTGVDDDVTLSYSLSAGSVSSADIETTTLRIIDPVERNMLSAPLWRRSYYGWNAEHHKGHARDLLNWSWLVENFNDGVRGGASGINLKYGASMRYDDGTSEFDNAGGLGTDLDQYGVCDPTSAQGDSRYIQTLVYDWSSQQAAWGFREPGAPYPLPNPLPLNWCSLPNVRSVVVEGQSRCEYYYSNAFLSNPCYRVSWAVVDPATANLTNMLGRAVEVQPFDLWRRFFIGDRLAFHYGTFAPSHTLETMGNVKLRAQDNPTYQCVPSTTSTIGQSVTVWSKLLPSTTPDLPALDHTYWTPIASLRYETDDVVNGSGVASSMVSTTTESHAHTGTYTPPSPTLASEHLTDVAVPAVIDYVAQPRSGWFRGPLITSINEHGQPLTIELPDGTVSAVQYGSKGRVVEAVYEQTDGSSGWFVGESGDEVNAAHSGRRAHFLGATPVTVERPSNMVSVASSLPAVVRFWIRPDDASHRIRDWVSVNSTVITESDSVACVDGWRLIELYVSSTPSTLEFSRTLDGAAATFHVDDIVVAGVSANTQCVVYDDAYLPKTLLGADHFATNVLYRPNGTVAGVSRETTSGLTTWAFTRTNVPSVPAAIAGAYESAALQSLEEYLPTELVEFSMPLPMRAPLGGFNMREDVLDVKVNKNGVESGGILRRLMDVQQKEAQPKGNQQQDRR